MNPPEGIYAYIVDRVRRSGFRMYKLPMEWVDVVKRAEPLAPYPTGNIKVFEEDEARRICSLYLRHTEKALWPMLIGINPTMDSVLGQAFKES